MLQESIDFIAIVMIDYNDIIIISLEARSKHQSKSVLFKYFVYVSVECSYIWVATQKLQHNNSTWYMIANYTVHLVYAVCVGVVGVVSNITLESLQCYALIYALHSVRELDWIFWKLLDASNRVQPFQYSTIVVFGTVITLIAIIPWSIWKNV